MGRLPVDPQMAAPGSPGAASRRRRAIMLHYDDDSLGIGKRLLFEADTPATALEIAAGEAAGRHARLFVDGEPLCSLLKADDENPYWIVAGLPGEPPDMPGQRQEKIS